MFRDVRQAVRMLAQARGWTTVVVVSLGLGIGANTALFSAVNGLLLKKVPVDDPGSLVRLRGIGGNQMATSSSDYGFTNRDAYGGRERTVRTTFSYPMYEQFRAANQTMTDLFACAPYGRVNVVVDRQADIATAFISSGNYYQLLGVSAIVGRTIVPDDDRRTAPPVAAISYRYWRSRFAGDRAAIGRVVQINNVPVTIVGVLPESLALDPQLSTGLPRDPGVASSRLDQPTYWWLQVMGRLKPGVTPAQVQANLGGMFQQTARAGFDSYLASLPEGGRSASYLRNRTAVSQLRAEPGDRGIYDANTEDLRAVTILTIVVALVLLIVCANVANLLLSRATGRQKEISVRLSLGATRARLVRQLLTESLLLSSLGGAFGILVGYWGRQLLPGSTGRATVMDWRVVAFVAAVTTLTAIVFGLAPALRASSANVSSALKDTSRTVAGGRSALSRALLVVQVAISLVLLIGAGLFLRTVQNLRHVNVGFDPNNVVLFRVNPQLNRYDDKRIKALYAEMMDRLQAVNGVRAVALSDPALLSGNVSGTGMFVQGETYAEGEKHDVNRVVVSASFFEAMQIPVLVGRGFTSRDVDGAPFVAIVNEAAVKKYFANRDPIGRRFGSSVENSGKLEVVGVLKDTKYDSLREPAPPTIYVPYTQMPTRGGVVFEVRTAADPLASIAAIREAVRQIDANLPLQDVSTQMEQVEQRFMQEKLFAQAYALFGGLALALASIGLFGLMSYSVARRTNEIGIRMALGAQREDVLRLVMQESMTLVGVGMAIGLAAAVAANRLVTTLLFGLAPTDPRSIGLALIAMIAVSTVAGYLPARRASRVDPMTALHYE
ncbi:MAG: ABC transporter permease [Acidobacteria bacterium]|nr:MAG: ABC transporter permease [Acidobacteriota bacterium]